MPRKKLSETDIANRLLLGEISKGRFVLGESHAAMCAAVGMNQSTVSGPRRRDPGTYRLCELRRLAKHYGWTAQTVAQILCVPYEESNEANAPLKSGCKRS